MLAVVEHQQQASNGDVVGQHVDPWTTGLLSQAQGGGSLLWHEPWFREPGKVDKPGAILELRQQLCGDLETEPRLPGPASARQAEEPVVGELID